MKKEKSINIRWLYLVVGTISMLFAGVIYAWSILKTPFAAELGWNSTVLSVNFTITMICFCLGGVLGGILAKKIGSRIAIIIGAVLIAAGFLISSGLKGNSAALLYIAYGVLGGFGIGIPYNTILSTVNAWFPDKKGTSMGIMLMAFGASTLVIGKIADGFFQNPMIGWRKAFVILGIAIGVVLFVTGLIVRRPSDTMVLPQPKQGRKRQEEMVSSRDYTTLEMVKKPVFWMAFFSIMFVAAVGNSVISFAKELSISVGAMPSLATLMVGILSVCNGLGRIIFGALFDSIGYRKSMLLSSVVTIVAAGLLFLSVLGAPLFVCIIGLCLIGFSYGSCPTTATTFVSVFFGMQNFPTNFSVINFNLIGTSFIATVSNILYAKNNSYLITFIFLIVLATVSLVINWFIKQR